MRLTVAICTWNRAALLDQTLARLRDLRVPAGVEWELLVVNNNCTDATDAVAARHADALPLRLLHEPAPGKSHACNLVVREAAGEYLLWTDDDVLVEPGWMEAYAAAFARHPDAAVFGGPVRPWFEGPPPWWLRQTWDVEDIALVFATRPRLPAGSRIVPPDLPFGANMAVRHREQAAHRYDPAIGVIGGRRRAPEDGQVVRDILAGGASGWWVPDATVRHHIPPYRQQLGYVRKYYAEQFAADLDCPPDTPRLFGRPRWLWRDWAAKELRYRWARLTRPPRDWVRSLCDASIAWGTLHNAAEGGACA